MAKITNGYRVFELVQANSDEPKEVLTIKVQEMLNAIPGNHITTSNAACYVWNAMKKIKNGVKPKPTREKKDKVVLKDKNGEPIVYTKRVAEVVIPDVSLKEMDKRYTAWMKEMDKFTPPAFLTKR